MKCGLADHHCVKVNVLLKTDNICHSAAQQINKFDHNSSSSLGLFIQSSPGVYSYPIWLPLKPTPSCQGGIPESHHKHNTHRMCACGYGNRSLWEWLLCVLREVNRADATKRMKYRGNNDRLTMNCCAEFNR